MIKYIKFLGILMLGLLLSPQVKTCSETPLIHHVTPNVCKPGLQIGPGGHFGVIVFCDDGAGTTVGVVALTRGPEGQRAETDAAWPLDNRFWQEAQWARDVSFFQWSPDGTQLRLRTNYIYGTNKLYTLDLVHRKIISAVDQPIKDECQAQKG